VLSALFFQPGFGKIAIAGLFHEEIPSPSTFYQTVIPILYQFELPKWNRSEISLPIGGANCSTPEWSESSICPTKFYLPQVQNRFTDYLFNAQPLVNTFEFMNATPQDSNIEFDCGVLGKHFRDIYIDDAVLNKYVTRLRACSPPRVWENVDFFQRMPNYKYNVTDVYLKLRQGFFNEVWMKVHDGRIDAGLWSNALNVLHSLTYANYHMEVNRWKLGLSDCQAGRIPSTLLPPSFFADSLQDLFDKANKADYTPVISPDDVGNYYNAQIADCTFTNDTILVRLLIPVTKAHQSHSLIRVKSGHFWDDKNERLCRVYIDEQHPYYLIDNLAEVVYETDCMPHEFCHVPTAKSPARVNSCVSAYINGHYENIVKYCKLICDPLSPYHFIPGNSAPVIVQKVDHETFLVTVGGTDYEDGPDATHHPWVLKLSCVTPNSVSEDRLISFKTGAMEVRLPCRCGLFTGPMFTKNFTLLLEESTKTCGTGASYFDTVQIVQKEVVPLHWVKETKLHELKNRSYKDGRIELTIDDSDLEIKESDPYGLTGYNFYSSEKFTGSDDSGGASGGVKTLLTLYFIFLLVGFGMLAFLTFRLKSMGVNVNPLTMVSQSHEISYRNVQDRHNGLLSQD
jgi:hypothetical protein